MQTDGGSTMTIDENGRERLPLPSEDTGDLVEAPLSGETDDPLVASEEGVPYIPPSDPVLSRSRFTESGPDIAGTAPTAAGELEREDDIQPDEPDETEAAPEDELESEAGEPAGDVELIRDLPTDDELAADVIEALRDSDVPAGDRLAIAAVGGRVTVRGLVESIDVLDELLGIVGDVPGVEEVVDEVAIEGL
jgi:hypothetical protein